jgi:hypothetical protein
MSTILLAAARGARIQMWGSTIQKWFEVTDMFIIDDCRIHPDDEALRFGPISTALRTAAETCKYPYTGPGLLAETLFNYEWEYPIVLLSDWPHAQMFLLLLAEAIAEEGL